MSEPNPPLNLEQQRLLANHLLHQVGEHLEAFAIVGYHRKTGQRVVLRHAMSPASNDAVNNLLVVAVGAQNYEPPAEENFRT